MTRPSRISHDAPKLKDFWLQSQGYDLIGPLSMTLKLKDNNLRPRLEALAQFADIFEHPEFTAFPSFEVDALEDATPVEEEMAWQADRFRQIIVDYGWVDTKAYDEKELDAFADLSFDEIVETADVHTLKILITSSARQQENYPLHWEECFEDGSLQQIVRRAKELLTSLDQWYDRAQCLGLRFRDYTAKEHQMFVPDRVAHPLDMDFHHHFQTEA